MSDHSQVPDFNAIRVLVYGDLMLDRYWYGQTSRISPEAPVPIVHVRQNEVRPGGAANVALNIASLGGKVMVLGLVGEDKEADQLRMALQKEAVDCQLLAVPGIPTVTKLRVIGQQQQLIRMDFEEIFRQVEDAALFQTYVQELSRSHVVVLSDYAKGALANSLRLIQLANQHKIPVLVDPKNKDFSQYRGATLVTPNKAEFEAIVGHWHSEEDLEKRGRKIIAEYDLGGLLITRGKEGMTLIEKNKPAELFKAKAREVYDVTGAGDTVIGVVAAAVAAGCDFPEAVHLANTAAGLVVMKLGAASVTVPELRRAIMRQGGEGLEGVLTENELIMAVADARAHGETIVMTNGCFDILHSGHVQYLRQAKALGKRLIVAVNSNDSVRRLKGPTRPINDLADRMGVLAALRAVDWIVPFTEDTPARLIQRVLPDVLVKGGDYRIEEIAGSDVVLANGGKVKILDFRHGFSTTQMIQRMKETV